jgi:hypothetical protein
MNKMQLQQMKARQLAEQQAGAERLKKLNLEIRKAEIKERQEQVRQIGEFFSDLIEVYEPLRSLNATQQKLLVKQVKQQVKELAKAGDEQHE